MASRHSSTRKRARSPPSVVDQSKQRRGILPELTRSAFEQVNVSNSDMALAFAIVRSLPPQYSIDSYIDVLRQNIHLNPRAAHDKLRYVDSHQFWKDQFQKLHERNVHLEVQVSRLQALSNVDELHETVADLHDLPLPSIHLGNPRSLKSLERSLHNIQSGRNTSITIYDSLSILRSAKQLFDLVQNTHVAASLLSDAIFQVLRQLSHTFRIRCGAIDTRTNKSFQQELKHISRIYNLTIKALKHLCRDIHGRTLSGQLIAEFLHVLTVILSNIKDLCVITAKSNPAGINNAECRNFLFTNTDSESMFPQCGFRLRCLISLAKLVLSMFSCEEMDSKVQQVVEVFRGMLAILLNRVGGLISEDVFNEHLPSSDRPAQISILSADHTATPRFREAIKLEGELLAWIVAEIYTKRVNGDCLMATMLVGSDNVETQTSFNRARRILQDSLMKGIFGSHSLEFSESLNVPEDRFLQVERSPIIDNLGSPIPSFVTSMWDSVGWSLFTGSEDGNTADDSGVEL